MLHRSVLMASALLLTGCNPFDAMTTQIDKQLSAVEVAQLELLAPNRKLPATASQVRLYFIQFQDPFMNVRFDAPIKVAREFAEQQTDQKLQPGCPQVGFFDDEPDWWLRSCPAGSEFVSVRSSDDPPARQIVVVPNGPSATVWLETFGT